MITPQQIRGARAMLGLTQADLAKAAGISATALNNIERGAADPKASTLAAIQSAIEAAGVIFIDPGEEGPGVQLRRLKRGMLVAFRHESDFYKKNPDLNGYMFYVDVVHRRWSVDIIGAQNSVLYKNISESDLVPVN